MCIEGDMVTRGQGDVTPRSFETHMTNGQPNVQPANVQPVTALIARYDMIGVLTRRKEVSRASSNSTLHD